MQGNSGLLPVGASGVRAGFANLFAKESGDWWRTRTWWLYTLIWAAALNGMVAMILNFEPLRSDPSVDIVGEAVMVFAQMGGLLASIGSVVRAQSAVIGEKQLGTAMWVLSKPVSRSGFVLAKFGANALGGLFTMVLVPGAVALVEIYAFGGRLLPLGGFGAGLVLIGLQLLFFLALTLLLGTVFQSRGPVLGIAFALILGADAIRFVAPWIHPYMPWALPQMAQQLMLGGSPGSAATPLAVAAWTVLFLVLAVWRFGREDF